MDMGVMVRCAAAEARAQGITRLPKAGLVGAGQILRARERQAGRAVREVEIAHHLHQRQDNEVR